MNIDAAIDVFGIAGKALCMHTSLHSFAPRIDADTLLDALLNAGCTIMVPTFTYDLEQPAPADERPKRNGTRYPNFSRHDRLFRREENRLSLTHIGGFPAAILARSARVRGWHPLNSFTAIGPLAHQLIDGQTPDDVYAPLDAIVGNDGLIVLAGVTYTSMTLMHLAESRAGRKLFQRWAKLEDGEVVGARVGSCSAGFAKFETVLDPMATLSEVQGSEWRVLDAKGTLLTITGMIQRDPSITHCQNPNCERCPDAIAGGPISTCSLGGRSRGVRFALEDKEHDRAHNVEGHK